MVVKTLSLSHNFRNSCGLFLLQASKHGIIIWKEKSKMCNRLKDAEKYVQFIKIPIDKKGQNDKNAKKKKVKPGP